MAHGIGLRCLLGDGPKGLNPFGILGEKLDLRIAVTRSQWGEL